MIMFSFLMSNLTLTTNAFSANGNEAISLALPERGICAHRGAQDSYPENTIPAFREAIRLGAHMIELDVNLTKDGHMVIMHDLTVDRTTDGKGKISELTLAEIKKLDAGGWKHPIFKGERVPTLAEALAIMPRNIWINIHLKKSDILGEKVAKLVVSENRTAQAFLACGASAARAARSVSDKIKICNMENQGNSPEYVDQTIAMHAEFIQIMGGDISSALVEKLKAAHVHINYFGISTKEKLRQLLALGIDFPLVDNPEEMLGVAAEFGIKPVKPVW